MTPRPPSPPTGADPSAIGWRVLRSTGPAEAFHQRSPDPDGGHQIWIHTTPTPALIVGSTQPLGLVRRDRAEADGIEVCRRRSGGGLVHLDPASDCWIDAIVPTGSPLWEADVGLAFHWLGELWADVLTPVLDTGGPAQVHRPRPGRTGRSLWCFAELGHGEVTLGANKVVGLSQRRTRDLIRLQSLVLGDWPGPRLLPHLDLEAAKAWPRVDLETIDPSTVLAGPPPGVRLPEPDVLIGAFVERIGGPPPTGPPTGGT